MAALLAWQETPQTGDLDHIDGYSMSLKNHSLVHLHLLIINKTGAKAPRGDKRSKSKLGGRMGLIN